MPGEIIAAAAGIVGKAVAKPVSDAALRREAVIRALKKLHLDPKVPPQDFDSLYAYALIEYCYGHPAPVLAFFRDPYVQEAFRRSFVAADWTRLRDETTEALRRNAETHEFGHLGHAFEEQVEEFTAAFQGLVDRSRAPHETRLENKVDEVSRMLAEVLRARDHEEEHRQRKEPARAEATPAERLRDDVRAWFDAVGYDVRGSWEAAGGTIALLVHVPRRRGGRFDRVVALCVPGELGPHHLRILDTLAAAQQADEGWGLAHLRISESARRQTEGDRRLFCYSFDELIDMEADFEPYIAWVEEEVRRRGIDTRYVPLSCRKDETDPATGETLDTSVYGWRTGGLDAYVQAWLGEPTKEHLSLLGEFGMGKSWFALHLAGELARGWRDARRKGVPRPRIPLVIPLRDYAKQTSVEALLSDFLFRQHAIGMRSYQVFRVLNRMGRLLLVFDGFDEMAARSDRHTMVENFWQLATVVEPGAKVLLSSRTEHFPHAREARDVLNAKLSTAASARHEGPAFDIVELVPFDDEQIRLMLGHAMDEQKVATVMAHHDVRDLLRRPVMSELVMDALPDIEEGAAVDLARVYLYAIRRKMDKDILTERTFTSRADKLYFLCEVAWEMLSTDRLSLNYREFPDRLRACFGPAVAAQRDLDYWDQDMRNQGMLVRNADGDYGPSHKSLLEFLVAFKFAAELGVLHGDFLAMLPLDEAAPDAEERTWSEYFATRGADGRFPALAGFRPEPVARLAASAGARPLDRVVFNFLATMVGTDHVRVDRLMHIIEQSVEAEPPDLDGGFVAGNCANLVVAAGGDFEGADLAGVDLSGFTPAAFELFASMRGADLRGANLVRANLPDVVLVDADLRGAHLDGCDNLLLADWDVRDVLSHPGGAITAVTSLAVFHWPEGDLGREPMCYEGTADHDWDFAHIFPWGENDWAYATPAAGKVVSSTTGKELLDLPSHSIASIEWQGVRAVLTHDRGAPVAEIVEPGAGRVLAEVALPGRPQQGGFGVHREGLAGWSVEDGVLSVSLYRPSARNWETLHHRPVTTRQAALGHGLLFREEEEDIDLVVDLRTGAVIEIPGARLHDLPCEPWEVAVCARRGTVYFATDDGVSIVGAGVTSTNVPVALGVSGIRMTADGTHLLTGSHSGEVALRDATTGEVISATTLNENITGARFSRTCGLEPHVLDAIELAGGIVTD